MHRAGHSLSSGHFFHFSTFLLISKTRFSSKKISLVEFQFFRSALCPARRLDFHVTDSNKTTCLNSALHNQLFLSGLISGLICIYNMSAKAISEATGKSLLSKHLSVANNVFVKPKFVQIGEHTDLQRLLDENPWLVSDVSFFVGFSIVYFCFIYSLVFLWQIKLKVYAKLRHLSVKIGM